jgi:hypothetical protein
MRSTSQHVTGSPTGTPTRCGMQQAKASDLLEMRPLWCMNPCKYEWQNRILKRLTELHFPAHGPSAPGEVIHSRTADNAGTCSIHGIGEQHPYRSVKRHQHGQALKTLSWTALQGQSMLADMGDF